MPVRLYNLTQDPYEKVNLAGDNPYLVKNLLEKLEKYKMSMISPNIAKEIPQGNPKNFHGFYQPGWCSPKWILLWIHFEIKHTFAVDAFSFFKHTFAMDVFACKFL